MESETVVRGPGFASLLTLLFIAFKLTGVIAWPWILVFAPLWITFVASIVLVVLVLLIEVI